MVVSVAATVVVLPILFVVRVLLLAVDPLTALRVGHPLVILLVAMRRAAVRTKSLLGNAAIVVLSC